MNTIPTISRTAHYLLALGAIFIVAIGVRLICFSGLIGSDDLTYNRTAYTLATNTFAVEYAHRETRLGLPLAVSLAFRLFGVHEWSSAIVPFASFILTFWVLTYMATSFWGRWTGLMAALLYTFLPIEMYYATILLPDLPSSACMALSSALLYQSERQLSMSSEQKIPGFRIPTWLLSLFSGLALGWAYLIRETAVFFGLFAAGYMLYLTWRDKAIRPTRLMFWGGLLVVVGFELGVFTWLTGNPLYRYMAIEHGSTPETLEDMRRYFYVPMPIYIILDRVRALFYVPDFGVHYFFGLAGLIYGFRKRIPHWGYVTGWFLTILGLYCVGSTSLTQYAPLRTVPRYFLAASVPGILIVAKFFEEMAQFLLHSEKNQQTFRFFMTYAIPTAVAGLITWLWFSVARLGFLLGIVAICSVFSIRRVRTWLRQRVQVRYLPAVLPAILLYITLLPGIYTTTQGGVMRARVAYERELRRLFGAPLQHAIYADERTAEVLEYLYQYQHDQDILEVAEIDSQSLKNAYVVVNWERLFFLNHVYLKPIPEILREPPAQWRLIGKIGGDVNPCLIYQTPE